MRAAVEEFVYMEADLLDRWQLEEWLGLLAPDASYLVPATDRPDGDPESTLHLVHDDMPRLRARVAQLMKKNTTWAEQPLSRTRRMITNVRVTSRTEDVVVAQANFMVHRFRYDRVSTYIGRYEFTLLPLDGSFRIRRRKAILDLESLSHPAAMLSFIL